MAKQFVRAMDITPGKGACKTGHQLFPEAMLNNHRIIYKLNKHNQPELSQFEVAFGNLAALLAHDLTPQQILVNGDDGEISGLAIQNICYLIEKREFSKRRTQKIFYEFSEESCEITPKMMTKGEKCPSTFFNKLPLGFFSQLMRKVDREEWSLDMASLAGILATSYTLEEDDLHKGNFGCYAVKKDGKPHFVFFKIDHDMMFADALMSFGHARVNHLFRRDAAFDITASDLKNFPYLQNSVNHYWPTTFSLGTRLNDDRAYHHSADRRAFRHLVKNKAFNQAKWQAFYRYILIPPQTVRSHLEKGLDRNVPAERAKLNMILHAFVARQARLRAVLFTIPDFRHYLGELDAATYSQQMLSDLRVDGRDFTSEIKRHQGLCKKIDVKDSPLHIAIRMGDFRYYDNWSVYSRYRDTKNSQGKRPIDVALELAANRTMTSSQSVRSNPAYAVNFLLHKGATLNDKLLRTSYKNYSFSEQYLNQLLKHRSFKTINDLKKAMQRIDDDYRISLKMKKRFAFNCLEEFIKQHQGNKHLPKMLMEFKRDLNGHSKMGVQPAVELQFIRQLRSRLWIIRKIRGIVGGTSTQVDMTRLIDKTLEKYAVKSPGCLSMFKCFSKNNKAQDQHKPQSWVSLP